MLQAANLLIGPPQTCPHTPNRLPRLGRPRERSDDPRTRPPKRPVDNTLYMLGRSCGIAEDLLAGWLAGGWPASGLSGWPLGPAQPPQPPRSCGACMHAGFCPARLALDGVGNAYQLGGTQTSCGLTK